jgi:hypothetical protein
MVNVVSSPSAERKTVSEHSETQYQRECVSKLRQSVTDLQVSVSKEAQPTFAFVPPYHPAFRPHCLSPITQVCHRFAIYLGLVPHPLTRFVQILERQGWKWLEPEYANKTLQSGKQIKTTQGWHTGDATLVIQYWNPSKHTEQLFVEAASNRYVMGIASKNVIGGSKLDQYVRARDFIRNFHNGAQFNESSCTLNEAQLQPEQYLMSDANECRDFFDTKLGTPGMGWGANAEAETWFVKGDEHGARGIRVVKDPTKLREEFGACSPPVANGGSKHFIVQRAVAPLLLGQKKMDFRVFMIVMRTSPLLVYMHEPSIYIRLANADYSDKEYSLDAMVTQAYMKTADSTAGINVEQHYWNVSRLEKYLATTAVGKDRARGFFAAEVLPFVRSTMRLLAFSSNISAEPGSFHIFALDFVLSGSLQPLYLEANQAPAFVGTNPPGDNRCAEIRAAKWLEDAEAIMFEDTFELLREAHESPTSLKIAGMARGSRWKSLELVHRDSCNGDGIRRRKERPFDPCIDFLPAPRHHLQGSWQ